MYFVFLTCKIKIYGEHGHERLQWGGHWSLWNIIALTWSLAVWLSLNQQTYHVQGRWWIVPHWRTSSWGSLEPEDALGQFSAAERRVGVFQFYGSGMVGGIVPRRYYYWGGERAASNSSIATLRKVLGDLCVGIRESIIMALAAKINCKIIE